ncbi:unnamed protein product [Darwinula stevensoni]|uniref:t-SNARE coiled-coil homology domain-containing protein n=1 Tax=Darwinula stevensoni TaxID=69355 RepID=A0A7R8X2B5_9CRUS|nr:unnamed protein product [Darwinula stevensoni]CAG0883743.1 unnamed protein product [Darwinula stevensoni]
MRSPSWPMKYEECQRLVSEVEDALSKRDQYPQNAQQYSANAAAARRTLMKLQPMLVHSLEETAKEHSSFLISRMERDRREELIHALQRRTELLQNELQMPSTQGASAFSSGPSSSTSKEELFRTSSASQVYGHNQSESSFDHRATSFNDPQFQRQQQQRLLQVNILFEEQDEGLDMLAESIRRQKNLAQAINVEATSQTEILDDLARGMEQTHDRIVRETGEVKVITRKTGTCWYWVAIFALLIAIIIVLSVPG